MSCRSDNSDPNSSPGDQTPCDSTRQSCTVPPCNQATILRPSGSLSASSNPATSWLSSPCFHFDFQGVVSGSAGPYVLDFNGQIDPAAHYTPQWTLEAAAGTLASETTLQPTHTAPAAAGEGNVTLQGMRGGTAAGCSDTKRVKIYRDHLARDRDNFGTGGSCRNTWSFSKYGVTVTMSGTWNCHGSTVHAYNGSGTGNANDTTLHGMVSGWTPQVYNAPITWSTLVSNLSRGDIVAFYASGSLQHTHTCRQSSTMYGANNEDVRGPETYIWAECTSERWWNIAGINNPPYPDCDRAIIYKRP